MLRGAEQIVHCAPAGGMPAPEQSPVMEEGLLLPIRDGGANHAMEPDSTATNILASVKEQVQCCLFLMGLPPLFRSGFRVLLSLQLRPSFWNVLCPIHLTNSSRPVFHHLFVRFNFSVFALFFLYVVILRGVAHPSLSLTLSLSLSLSFSYFPFVVWPSGFDGFGFPSEEIALADRK